MSEFWRTDPVCTVSPRPACYLVNAQGIAAKTGMIGNKFPTGSHTAMQSTVAMRGGRKFFYSNSS